MTKQPYTPSKSVAALAASLRRITILDEQVAVLDSTTEGTLITDTPSISGFAYDPEGLVDKWSEANLIAWRGALRTLLDLEVKAIQGSIKKKIKWGGGGDEPKPAARDDDDDEDPRDDY